MGSQPETMIFKISVSVWRIPSRASWPTLSTVASTPSLMMPSPGRKQRPWHGHAHGQDGGVHAGGDLGRAGGLGAVADDAGDVAQGVDNDLFDLRLPPAVEPADAGPRAGGGADGPAVGGELADLGFWWMAVRLLTHRAR